jgi:hypothetical protein
MAGNTATISVETFRADWCADVSIASLCVRYTITKDQVIRLRDVWELPLRHDRRRRAKPPRQRDPTPAEIARACQRLQESWDDRTREDRRVIKSKPVSVTIIDTSDSVKRLITAMELDAKRSET